MRELASLINEDPGNCSRELVRFENEGIVISHKRAKAKYYSFKSVYINLQKIKDLLSKQASPEEREDAFVVSM